MSRKIVVIGGVAAGMSAASRARRNDPDASIIVFQKENAVSYGSCGLPYYISDDIKDAETLIAISADEFRQKRNIDVRLNHEGISFNPREKTVEIRDLGTGMIHDYPYDKLIIATGARAAVPPIPGKDLKNVFVVRNLTDGQNIKSCIENDRPASAVVVGGGYIGLEMAEALSRQGLRVSVVEAQERVMLNMDPELSEKIESETEEKGCKVYTSNGVQAILGSDRVNSVRLMNGDEIAADMVILSIGVKPNVEFALTGGVRTGKTGAIEVNQKMETNVQSVYAAGDCAEVKNLVTNKMDYIPLGTTANKQGRVAGDNASGRFARFSGVAGTAVVKIFDLEVARTGITTAQALNLKMNPRSVIITGKSRAGYYPGKEDITLKLIFRGDNGRLLGAHMVGKEGVAKRIDVLATALQQKMTVMEISELDLSYAPPYAPVWDPILIAANQAAKSFEK